MTDRPILFSGPMIRAMLEGRKTQTRRPAWRQVITHPDCPKSWLHGEHRPDGYTYLRTIWQKAQRGDRLWVRETCCIDGGEIFYKAGPGAVGLGGFQKWRPSIHMPRWASRLTLIVSKVRYHRLREITEEDALAEGIVQDGLLFHVPGLDHPNKDFPELSRATAWEMYGALWDTINGAGSWLGNPGVIALDFTVHQHNIDKPCKTCRVFERD